MATPTPVFPGGLATAADLKIANNLVQTTVRVAISAGDTILFVASTAGFTANCLVSIESEIVAISSTGANNTLIVAPGGRGFDGTTAASHPAGAKVSLYIVAWHHNALASEIEAIEGFLGPNGQNIGSLAGNFVWSTPYNFAPQSPGGSLVAGNNPINLNPVPQGMNGSDQYHLVYISGGTGTPEAALITGGIGVAGSPGQIIVKCAYPHSGAWTIASASAGIMEAAIAIGGTGTILVPDGISNLYGTLTLPTSISLIGQGWNGLDPTAGTVIKAAAGANPAICVTGKPPVSWGLAMHRAYNLQGSPGSGVGFWIGGDPAGVFAPTGSSGGTAQFTKLDAVRIENFPTAVNLQDQNFSTFNRCAIVGKVLIPNGATGIQYTDFHDSIISVTSGVAFQMDSSDGGAGTVSYFGGQISGKVTGISLVWFSWGTHYEPNNFTGEPLVDFTGGTFHARGGLMGGHGGATPYLVRGGGSGTWADIMIDGVKLICDAAIPNAVVFAGTGGGSLVIRNLDPLNIVGGFSNFASGVYKLQVMPTDMEIEVQTFDRRTQIAAAANLVFPLSNFPRRGLIEITGATIGGSGITAVSGLIANSYGVLWTDSAQTFTAGASIARTVTLTPGIPYTYLFDGAFLRL